jgi:hypothetical protein
MDFKADGEGLAFIATGEIAPVMDYASKTQRADRNGEPLWGVRVMVASTEADAGRSELITVKVPGSGKPAGLVAGLPVRVVGLRLTPWSRGEAGGVGFRAERIEPAAPSSGAGGPVPRGQGSGQGSGQGRSAAGPGTGNQ